MASLGLETMGFNPDTVAGWLSSLWPRAPDAAKIIAGINDDDCGVIQIGSGVLVVTTDFLNKKPMAEQLGIGGLTEFGRLTVASNLSDLYGTGAEPIALLIGAAMRPSDEFSDFRQFMEGVHYESSRWGVPVIGGDSKIGRDRAFYGVAVGFAKSRKNLFLKNGARAGDLLWLSGPVGGCASAVLGLSRLNLSSEWRQWATKSLIEPDLPAQKSTLLSSSGLGNGGTDVSDGLAYDLGSMCSASNVGGVIHLDKLPIPSAARHISETLGYPEWLLGFGTGGDFQFLVTAAPDHRGMLERFGFYEIGVIVEGSGVLVQHPETGLVRLPALGHSDARGLTFDEEVEALMKEINEIVNRGFEINNR